jgi:hypothetical protein
MNSNRLVVTVDATHQSLGQRLEEATRPSGGPLEGRRARARIDAFMAATSRHLAAVDEALLPDVRRRLPDGHQRAKSYLHEARRLEQAIARLKARLYGELHVAYLPWSEVWDEVRRQFASHNEAEVTMTRDLTEALGPEGADALADRIYRAELTAPTRAHPYLPHTGVLGHTARKIWAVADRFWDMAEGRVIPPPIRPKPKLRHHESLMAQYFVGEPMMDAGAPMVEHRRRKHPPKEQTG